jgi:haloalkane dehalogenase
MRYGARYNAKRNAEVATPAGKPPWLDRDAYPFEPRFVQVPGGWMHYVDEGRGPAVLFVHGTPTWSFEFRRLIKALSPSVRCLAPDHLGFGLSERPAAFAYTPEAHADALRGFADALHLADLTLVVHDFGGPIGLPLCFDAVSRVRRVVLINTWLWPLDDDPQMRRRARVAGSLAGRWLYRHANASLRVLMPRAYGNRRALTPAIHRQYLEVFRDPHARVRVLHTLAHALTASHDYYARLWAEADALGGRPALILWGMRDPVLPRPALERWRARLPHATVLEFTEAGHWPHEEEPEAVIAALRRFLTDSDEG